MPGGIRRRLAATQSTRLLLDAAFLVAIAATARFRAATRRAARSLQPATATGSK